MCIRDRHAGGPHPVVHNILCSIAIPSNTLRVTVRLGRRPVTAAWSTSRCRAVDGAGRAPRHLAEVVHSLVDGLWRTRGEPANGQAELWIGRWMKPGDPQSEKSSVARPTCDTSHGQAARLNRTVGVGGAVTVGD